MYTKCVILILTLLKGYIMKFTKKNFTIFIYLTIFISCILTKTILAQGFIIPHPGNPALPVLTDHQVKVEITDQCAKVIVEQVFYNPSDQDIEGTYYFPLPKDASISDFKMHVNGKILSGELLEKNKARKIYEDIIRRKIDPALLEYINNNLFSAKIFPIPAKKDRKIVLEYSSLLKLDGDLVQFSYPLRGQIANERNFRRPHHRPFIPRFIEGEKQSNNKGEEELKPPQEVGFFSIS